MVNAMLFLRGDCKFVLNQSLSLNEVLMPCFVKLRSLVLNSERYRMEEYKIMAAYNTG